VKMACWEWVLLLREEDAVSLMPAATLHSYQELLFDSVTALGMIRSDVDLTFWANGVAETVILPKLEKSWRKWWKVMGGVWIWVASA